MNTRHHWDQIYQRKAADAVSWFRPHLERSLSLIEKAAPDRAMSVMDVGGGESTLVDDLLAAGYRDVSVLDISRAAIDATRQRLGPAGNAVTWWVEDVTRVALPAARYDVWHDRAVFHFLTDAGQRQAYVRQVMRAVKPGGHVIVATFGPEGPAQCSGLDVVRYDAQGLHGEFGEAFRLVESATEVHQTPSGTTQQFIYCYCVKVS
ncbi:MAG: class I SAM-dependent methyltransferase [Polaromonas sp.]|uniref:class I SAM-dependent methyltransferase n=1 Tax=Polaromonas sp. TaxID=1869339 RepID=UPI002734FE0B|nr:class I SAM-dependent methyltransferase [Polaromonas sp.]MDP3795861.1 class I SAM-dependent methyltransferase [Polaromonas sp.]